MGIRLIGSSCNYGSVTEPKNPDPSKFNILRIEKIGRSCLVEIQYEGCTNYEGRKILAFYKCSRVTIKALVKIDPHFCDDEHLSPVARFEPTEAGWEMGKVFLKLIEQANG